MTCPRFPANESAVRTKRANSKGLTLVEVMIVVAVAAIIAAIAIPNYRDYVMRSKRSAARQVLMEAAQYLERNYTTAGCYEYADTQSCDPTYKGTRKQIVKPSPLLRAPSEGRQSYEVTWTFTNAGQGYTLTATPCGDAGASCPVGSETTFTDPTCGALTITQTGLRGAGGSIATCWQR